MKYNIFKKSLAIFTAVALFILLTYITPAKGTLQYPAFHKGMSYVAWARDSFSKPTSDESLKAMANIGTNCVAIIPTWYQDEYNSTDIKATDRTPSDSSLHHAIQKAHEYGMSVMVKPHIDLDNQRDCNRSDIGFQNDKDWQDWRKNYEKFITHYARIAQEENAEFFCVGTELSFAATRTAMWKDSIIPAVRKAFPGQITYAANWDEYGMVKFWDELDYAGVDAYFPLSKSTTPTYDEIKNGWKNWINDIELWQSEIKKPVIFTECGYPSADTAAVKPWEEAVSGKANTNIQADCYRAVFETFWNRPWFFGVYWWTWTTYSGSGGITNRGFTPQNKLAMDYLKEWYGKIVTKEFLYAGSAVDIRNSDLEERLRIEAIQHGLRYTGGDKKPVFTGEMTGKNEKRERDLPRISF